VSRRGAILIVEDDSDVRHSVQDALTEGGFQVFSAGDGQEALRLLADGVRPDLILLDLMMPVMDGWRFRREQRKVPAIAQIPIVLVTAYSVSRATLDELEPAGLLRKPMPLELLLSTVERLARRQPAPG
jgi:CheY-like chemotaxis protein